MTQSLAETGRQTHSIGPWRADSPREFAGVKWDNIIRSAKNDPVCSVFVAGYMAKEAKANAALIAQAPALKARVALLERLVQTLLDNDPDEPIADNGMTVLDGWREQARAALDGKVRG